MAKPTPLPLGRANPHVMQSRGAESYIMNFYSTNYSTAFSRPDQEFNKGRAKDLPGYTGNPEFKPRSAPLHTTSGFTSNERPQIYYRQTLDELDNPQIGRLLADNYNTITHLDYQPYQLNNGFEELPVEVKGQQTAYTQGSYNHQIPRPDQVYDLFMETKIRAPHDVLPKHKAKLHQIHNKDPLAQENNGYGPRFMSTEYASKFAEPKQEEKRNPSIGPKNASGFVLNKEMEDVLTNTPGERWLFNNHRPTGITDYKAKYQPYAFPRSETSLPNIMSIDKTKESTYTKAFKPSDEREPGQGEKLGTAKVGPKELSGHSHENGHVQTLDDPRRFITNYQMRHFDMNARGKDREGYVVGGVQNMKEDGFTKSTLLHLQEPINTFAELRNMNSYQSRSIRATNAFYDDHSHDHKYNLKERSVTFAHNNPYSINA